MWYTDDPITKLAQDSRCARGLEWIDANSGWVTDQQILLTEIPAPIFGEGKRGDAFKGILQSLGFKVRVDKAGNVAGERPGSDENSVILLAAHQWPQMVRAMGKPELATDPRFQRARERHKNRFELQAIIEEWLASFPSREDAIAAMDKERIPCAPVLTVNEAMAHPHLNERKTVRWVEDPLLGKVAIPGVPVKFSAWPDRTELRSARLGEDNERVLRDYLGVSDERIRALYENGTLVRDKTIG